MTYTWTGACTYSTSTTYTATNWTDSNTGGCSTTFKVEMSANRPVLGGIAATDTERDEWLDTFEKDNGKLTKKQRAAFKSAIAGWAVR